MSMGTNWYPAIASGVFALLALLAAIDARAQRSDADAPYAIGFAGEHYALTEYRSECAHRTGRSAGRPNSPCWGWTHYGFQAGLERAIDARINAPAGEADARRAGDLGHSLWVCSTEDTRTGRVLQGDNRRAVSVPSGSSRTVAEREFFGGDPFPPYRVRCELAPSS